MVGVTLTIKPSSHQTIFSINTVYPDLSYILHSIFGTEVDNGLSVVKTFGLLLALAILSSAYFLNLELKRKEQAGIFLPNTIQRVVGAPASVWELLVNALFGFIFGFKLLYAFQHFDEFKFDAPGVLFSSKGNLIGGIVGAAILAGLKYWEKQKEVLPKPTTQNIKILPSDRLGDITLIAAFTGILGAKVFAIFEDFDNLQGGNFFEILLSGSGLAIYGGLIGGTIGVIWYLRQNNIRILPFADAIAPALIMGYLVGRLGCQLSGDGDWGIVNANPTPSWWFLPDWLWSYTYPQNVLNQGVPIDGCVGNYCRELAQGVYPTPVYEMVMSGIIFLILWGLRKRLKIHGLLMCVYLMLNGVERYWIEKIRVNARYDIFGFQPTQAEIIAVLFFLTGAIGYWVLRKRGATA